MRMLYIMTDHLDIGSSGEQLACEYLSSLGYRILDRNFRTAFGEIDIIAQDPDNTLVIIEVKTFRSFGTLTPEDNLTRSKLRSLSRITSFYANANPDLISSDSGYRIDLIAVTLDPLSDHISHSKLGKNNFAVSHYKNIG